MSRPSWLLDDELRDAILELEELAHVVGATPPIGNGLEHVQAVVNAGGARDRLAQLILDRIGGQA